MVETGGGVVKEGGGVVEGGGGGVEAGEGAGLGAGTIAFADSLTARPNPT